MISHHLLLAALRWDPNIRGALIVLTGFSVLIGSVYLLLATNTGPRLGFMIAAAGLFGWLTVMGTVWTVFGIGIKGAEPSWKTLEVVTGDLSQSTVTAAQTFPKGWKPLPKSDKALADAEAAAAAALSSGSYASPFKKKEEYQPAEAFKKGGDTWLLTLRHRPHYAALQVKPAKPGSGNQQGETRTTVIMLRDLGNLRAPSFFFSVFAAIMFGIFSYSLHFRDKQAAARQASVP